MTNTSLSDAAVRLLERVSSAHPESFKTSARGRAAAGELTETGYITCAEDICSLTTAGLERLGMQAKQDEPSVAAKRAPREGSKGAQVIALLSRAEGATIAQLSEATDWLPHSVRGFIAGALRKTHGLTATSERIEDVRIYRLASQ